MNKRLSLYVTLVLSFILAFTVSGCKDEKKNKINPMVQELDETPDNALFVTLDKVANDSIYVTLEGTREKKVYGISEANAQGQIKGSLNVGDELSIYPQNKTKSILISINVTELKGQWFYDRHDHRGFKFGKRGSLSAINNKNISFREWKLLNGKLYLYYVDMQQESVDRHEDGVEEAEILHLSKETMQLRFRGAILNCVRSMKPLKF